ncbi:lamin tail domain-containing protein [Flagellimonas sp.]|uniref:lamin tail domain-containing protein n=1 Tax=Flagellimonas sp. TaxID=2058762 RepID=UPI003BAA0E8E
MLTAVLTRDGKTPQLVIRTLEDVDFTQERCPEIITEFTSNQIFISELADPDNNSSARFVELYNSASEPLDLNLWTLRRYTNANTELSSTIDLSGLIIGPESTLIISPNAEEFELVYGFAPDLGVSTNSPADSNGDDNLELVDPFGTIIDMFGVIGEDGSGTNHEFEDGRAVRNSNIMVGNPVYTFSEWTIFNDTGDAGTTKLPQNAPEDFTPGVRD